MRYTKRAGERLREQLGYELWLLEFLLAQSRSLRGDSSIDIRLENRGHSHVNIGSSDTIGAARALDVMAKVRLLAFVACYKIIDLIFEWALDQNPGSKQGRFAERLRELRRTSPRYPAQVARRKFLVSYFRAIHENLLEYRHEVVHRHGGELLADGSLHIIITKPGAPAPLGRLEMSGTQVEARAAAAALFARLALADASADTQTVAAIKHHLDALGAVHLLHKFGAKEPKHINVTVIAAEADGHFDIGLDYLRAHLAQSWGHREPFYDLRIEGTLQGGTIINWLFPMANIPKSSSLILTAADFPGYRV